MKTFIFLALLISISSLNLKKSYSWSNTLTTKAKQIPGALCSSFTCKANEQGGIRVSETRLYNTTSIGLEVYRMYTASTDPKHANMAKKFGSWWSLEKPSGTKIAYMTNNAICPEYNFMNRLVVCKLNIGVLLFVGESQSVKCQDKKILGPNKNMQVFIADAFEVSKGSLPASGKGSPFASCSESDGPLR